MKKFLACAFIVFSLVGCGKKGSLPAAASLTPEEQSDLEMIKNGGSMAAQAGYEITKDIRLSIFFDNFGEKTGCMIYIRPAGQNAKSIYSRFDLKVQFGRDVDYLIWTENSLSSNAGEVRLVVGKDKYVLDGRMKVEGGRATRLNSDVVNSLLSSATAKAVSGVVGNVEISQSYNLIGFERAYKFASKLCI